MLGRSCTEGFSPLPAHIMFILQEYCLHTAAAVRVVLHPVIVEDVCEGCLDLLVIITKLCVIGGEFVRLGLHGFVGCTGHGISSGSLDGWCQS